MKKLILPIVAAALLAALIFTGCGGTELIISIGDGMVENDSVSVKLVYGGKWKNGEKIFDLNYGHESEAVLADEYYVSFSDEDPLFADTIELHTFFTIKKADLEGRTVSGGKFSGKAVEVMVGDLASVLPAGEGTCTAEIVLHSSDTVFSDVTTFASHTITFEWDGGNVQIID